MATPPAPAPPTFSANFYREALDRLNEERQNFARLDIEGRDQENDFLRAMRDTDLDNDREKLGNRNRAGSRGTVFSSQYAKSTADTADKFNRLFGDLRTKRQLFLNADKQQRTLMSTGFNDFLRALGLQQAQSIAENGEIKGPKSTFANTLPGTDQTFAVKDDNPFLAALRRKYGWG